ncbi:MAG TPA: sigma factor [Pirellulaceae bacterium]|jgi:RNA polymerase sigma-70 factor (ECF subfamily)|nr:sigma factor [Pirellulaceae bacterium]
MDDANAFPSNAAPGRFATTRWSVVAAAGDVDSGERRDALEELCRGYWYPIYAFVRGRSGNAQDAQDLTQAFFAHAIEKGTLAKADRARGRFRTFLRAAIANFLADERAKAKAVRRGGGKQVFSLDFESGESRYLLEPSHDSTAERLYDRRWAVTLIEQALATLEQEWTSAGKAASFEILKRTISGVGDGEDYSAIGADLDVSPAAAKQAAYRLRRRYREIFREEVRRTVADDESVDDEIARLMESLGD